MSSAPSARRTADRTGCGGRRHRPRGAGRSRPRCAARPGAGAGFGRRHRHPADRPANAITDVAGVRVGHATIVAARARWRRRGPVRTGVTVVVAARGHRGERWSARLPPLNGNGEMTGTPGSREPGLLTHAGAITNTHSVGVVRDALVAYAVRDARAAGRGRCRWWPRPGTACSTTSTASTSRAEHVVRGARRRRRRAGRRGQRRRRHRHDLPRVQGRHRHRVAGAADDDGGYTVGVLVQANYGARDAAARRRRAGGPRDSQAMPTSSRMPASTGPRGLGHLSSSPPTRRCRRVNWSAWRAGRRWAWPARGCWSGNTSGDIILAFSTGNAVRDERIGAGDGCQAPVPPTTSIRCSARPWRPPKRPSSTR